MKKWKNNLDERQELKLMTIEQHGCWLAFWGLTAAIFVQNFFGNGDFKTVAGELAVFFCLGIYLVGSSIRHGIWDRRMKPDFKTNVIVSALAAIVLGVIWFFISYHNYHKLIGSIATGVFMFLSTGILCLTMLSLLSQIFKKREKQLEEFEEE